MFFNSLDDLPANAEVCIYGTGKVGKDLKKILEAFRKDIKLVSFIDSFNDGEVDGLKITKVKNISSLKYDFIVIASSFLREIENMLQNLNISNYKIMNSFITQIFTKNEIDKYKDEIEKVKSLLVYEEDKKLYDLLIKSRIGCLSLNNVAEYTKNNPDYLSKQYLEHHDKDKIEIVFEGGVFDGFNTYSFINNLKNLKYIYGFEPLPKFLDEGQYSESVRNSPKVGIYPFALWKERTTLNFLEDGISSKVAHDNSTKDYIKAISVDEFVTENNVEKVDLIKLDVEGAEPEVLEGAKNILRTHRPQLAISIYHQKEHLFEIPLFLNEILENYKYRIGHYSSDLSETVWYCIP